MSDENSEVWKLYLYVFSHIIFEIIPQEINVIRPISWIRKIVRREVKPAKDDSVI